MRTGLGFPSVIAVRIRRPARFRNATTKKVFDVCAW